MYATLELIGIVLRRIYGGCGLIFRIAWLYIVVMFVVDHQRK